MPQAIAWLTVAHDRGRVPRAESTARQRSVTARARVPALAADGARAADLDVSARADNLGVGRSIARALAERCARQTRAGGRAKVRQDTQHEQQRAAVRGRVPVHVTSAGAGSHVPSDWHVTRAYPAVPEASHVRTHAAPTPLLVPQPDAPYPLYPVGA